MINDADDPLTEGDFDGYTFVSNVRDSEDKTQATSSVITIRQSDPTDYRVMLDCGNEPDFSDFLTQPTSDLKCHSELVSES